MSPRVFQLCLFLLPLKQVPLGGLLWLLPSPAPPNVGSAGQASTDRAASVLGFPQSSSLLRELALLHGFCLDGQALGTDGQDHNEDAHHKCHHWPEEAVQEDNLIMCAMQENILRPAREWGTGKEEQSDLYSTKNSATCKHALVPAQGDNHP